MKPLPGNSRLAFTLVEVLGALAIVVVLAVLLISGITRAVETAQRSGCQARMRNIHIAVSSYASDHNNCLPAALADSQAWPGRIASYLSRPITKLDGETYCPATSVRKRDQFQRDRATWRTDYTVNGNAMSNTESQNQVTSLSGKMVLLYDGGGGSRGSAGDARETARHFEKFNVIFIDGHIETLGTFDEHKDNWKKP